MDINLLYKQRIFSLEDVMNIMSVSRQSASKALLRWQKKGIVRSIRKNMYTVVDLGSGESLVDKYEIASRVSPTSYISWHTALEYHGIAHQIFYYAYLGSESRVNTFSYDDTEYVYYAAPTSVGENFGIIHPEGNLYVRVTDLERTIVDCCNRIDRAGGAEELMHCLEGVVLLDEKKLKKYLALYDKVFLYQKIGFMLERIKKQANISSAFIEFCRKKGAKNEKRLTNAKDSNRYVKQWNLYVPDYLMNINQTTGNDIV